MTRARKGRVFAYYYNARVWLHSSAPTRLDLAGGTLDIWPLYLFHEGAQTLNAAITLRAECTLSTNTGGGLQVVSEDTGQSMSAEHWSTLTGREEPRLITGILRFFEAEHLTVVTRSASPIGAGLAGSSALNIALCGALAKWQQQSYTSEELITLALNLEAQVLRIPTGAQDYRPAMYGGLASVELRPTGVRRQPLALDPHELDDRIVLAHTGNPATPGSTTGRSRSAILMVTNRSWISSDRSATSPSRCGRHSRVRIGRRSAVNWLSSGPCGNNWLRGSRLRRSTCSSSVALPQVRRRRRSAERAAGVASSCSPTRPRPRRFARPSAPLAHRSWMCGSTRMVCGSEQTNPAAFACGRARASLAGPCTTVGWHRLN